ncbi:isoprenylcysteine carboxylmethyltransferase family protein [Bacillus sp. P14.5]|uniref:isoprenylcysteine carboxyl methyltransferase family protein n=1 Tax=Bacillus sp. P14.5 TaxID=1983400 RepID=UPI000DEB46A0|nr:isoprenylcysteine carboxylmethyltransferase family protein [Bacillus sp. P14.5]
MMFYLMFTVIAVQRMAELVIAKRNEKWMKGKGAREYGQKHYKLMVSIHLLFFISLLAEEFFMKRPLNQYWAALFILFLLTQAGRVWVITSLGRYWNTKIIVLPQAEVIAKGPYKFIKHPNYLIVTIELIVIPLIFNAYWTLFIFALLNQFILSVRIPLEEKALEDATNYQSVHQGKKRFIPMVKREEME